MIGGPNGPLFPGCKLAVVPTGDGADIDSTLGSAECDLTLQALESVIDGSLSGLADYHLLRQELDRIRALPERRDRERIPPPPAWRP